MAGTFDPKMVGTFEVDMTKFKEVEIDPWTHATLPANLKAQILANVEVLCVFVYVCVIFVNRCLWEHCYSVYVYIC